MRQEAMREETNDTERKEPDTRGLMFNTLNQLGCQPTANDDGTLSVQYQGEYFHMEFGGMYARVWAYNVGRSQSRWSLKRIADR